MGACGHTFVSTDEEFIDLLGLTEESKKLPTTLGKLFAHKMQDDPEFSALMNKHNLSDIEVPLTLEQKLEMLGLEIESVELTDVGDAFEPGGIYTRKIVLRDNRVIHEIRCSKKEKRIFKEGNYEAGYDFIYAYKPVFEKKPS